MRRIWKCLIAAVLILVMTFSFVACSEPDSDPDSTPDSLIVQTNAFFAPFEYYDNREIVGVDVEIMKKVGEKLDRPVEFINGDFGQIIDIISTGEMADVGAAGITITNERKQKVDFSIPYYTSVQYVVWKTDNNDISMSKASDGDTDVVLWEQLRGKKIGVQANTTGDIYVDIEINGDGPEYPGELNDSGASCTPYDSAQIATDALGVYVDCVVVDELPAVAIVNKNSGLRCAPLYYDAETATSEEYAMCVTKGNSELLAVINDVLQDLIDDVDDEGNNAIERMVATHLGIREENKDTGLFASIAEVFTNSEYMSYIWDGLKTTLIISVGAAILGLLLGIIVALVKIAYPKNKKALCVPNAICNAYVTIIRGTPVALQLFIMAFAILAIRGFPLVITAIITFGINSGAYVSESIRAGILSIDKGQTEAGRSLGLSGGQTMRLIVIPQAIKNVIPTIGNELVALIKETSIVSMVGLVDLTFAAKIIGAGDKLANYLVPMLVTALFYLAIVYALTFVIKLIEKKMRRGDRK